MTIPLKSLNRLRMGKDLAAIVQPSLPNHIAWIYIYPLVDFSKGHRGNTDYGDIVVMRDGDEDPIRGFLIRRLEIERQVAEDYYEDRRDEIGKPYIDQRWEVGSEEELESAISPLLNDFDDLHTPNHYGVRYRFESGYQMVPAEAEMAKQDWAKHIASSDIVYDLTKLDDDLP